MVRAAQVQNGRDMARVPGLDPAAPYASRLSARSALFTELHLLLDRERAALSSAEYRALVVTENKLSRTSAAARASFKTEDDVDQALDKVSRDLKAQIREGFTVVVK